MKRLLLAGGALIVSLSFTVTPAFAQLAKGPKSVASRNATCKADCLPDAPHGFYKPYHNDPTLLRTSSGKKDYAECVRKCLAPLPPAYLQKILIDAGLPWVGMSAASCLNCHVSYGKKQK